MRKLTHLFFLVFFSFLTVNAQQYTAELITKKPLDVGQFHGVDQKGNLYYERKGNLIKFFDDEELEFRDLQLGKIHYVDYLNPLRLLVFYKEANTVVFLDNRMNELDRINFNFLKNNSNFDFVSMANDNSVWTFNIDVNELQVYDHRRKKILARSIPIYDQVLLQKSNFNFCYLATENSFLKFNIYGSIIKQFNLKLKAFDTYKNRVLLKTQDQGYFLLNSAHELIPIDFPEISAEAFFLNDEKIYLYNKKELYIYTLKKQ
ncbi:hypothetical protein [Psychroflexus maritimus]|uniref:Uncharacterized protein n=1 Tax=Psychroflexus maritimus TaxID=2714865 RepID=A0A967DZA7_9FLAO|nr:hypothetical protein [Psychroflexus maritimus]NGZ90003.1 hypothetical protein [Psychroflexus maritimus]